MESLERNTKREDTLPNSLKSYFKDKDDFIEKVKCEYKKAEDYKFDIKNIRFVEKLIGRKKTEYLSAEERKTFFKEIESALYKIKKRKKMVAEHWNNEAKRAGFISGNDYTGNDISTVGDGKGLREFLKDN